MLLLWTLIYLNSTSSSFWQKSKRFRFSYAYAHCLHLGREPLKKNLICFFISVATERQMVRAKVQHAENLLFIFSL